MAAAEAVEKAAEVVDEALETVAEMQPAEAGVSKLSGLFGNHGFHILAALVVGGGVGAAVAFKLVEKKMKAEYEEAMKVEVQQTKDFYARLNKTGDDGEALTPQQLMEQTMGKDAVDAMRDYQTAPGQPDGPYATEEELLALAAARNEQGGPLTDETDEPTVVAHNIFSDAEGSDWDYEKELKIREENPEKPYIISQEEYLSNETDYSQAPLVYFEEDDILSDDQDIPVQEVDKTVGEDNLARFGHGSGDPKSLYIRNDQLQMEFEIAHSKSSYTKEIAGLGEDDAELQHSDRRGRSRRLSWGDDE